MGQLLNIVDGDIADLALDVSDERPVKPSLKRKILLGPCTLKAQAPKVRCQNFPGRRRSRLGFHQAIMLIA